MMTANLGKTISGLFPVFNESDCGIANLPPYSPDLSATPTILGGKEVSPPNKYPWQAYVLDDETGGFCGGIVLTNLHVITAAHCVINSEYLLVVLGAHSVINSMDNEPHNIYEITKEAFKSRK